MSEWFKEHDWKSCDAGMYPEVQILFSAPNLWGMKNFSFPTGFLYGFLAFLLDLPYFLAYNGIKVANSIVYSIVYVGTI